MCAKRDHRTFRVGGISCPFRATILVLSATRSDALPARALPPPTTLTDVGPYLSPLPLLPLFYAPFFDRLFACSMLSKEVGGYVSNPNPCRRSKSGVDEASIGGDNRVTSRCVSRRATTSTSLKINQPASRTSFLVFCIFLFFFLQAALLAVLIGCKR